MRELPILFSAPMVRAILEGRKTVTRRVFAPERMTWPRKGFYETHALRGGELMTTGFGPFHPERWLSYCPYGQPGDRLWVRETFASCIDVDEMGFAPESDRCLFYKADPTPHCVTPGHNGPEELGRWRPSIHMPRWASRITLEVTGVRVERLQDITYEQAIAEGITDPATMPEIPAGHGTGETVMEYARRTNWPKSQFRYLWVTINGAESWDTNPWVWVVEFKRVTP